MSDIESEIYPEVYVIVKYDIYPYFNPVKLYDTGTRYTMVQGCPRHNGWDYDSKAIMRRVTKEQFETAEKLRRDLEVEEREIKLNLKQKAEHLLEKI